MQSKNGVRSLFQMASLWCLSRRGSLPSVQYLPQRPLATPQPLDTIGMGAWSCPRAMRYGSVSSKLNLRYRYHWSNTTIPSAYQQAAITQLPGAGRTSFSQPPWPLCHFLKAVATGHCPPGPGRLPSRIRNLHPPRTLCLPFLLRAPRRRYLPPVTTRQNTKAKEAVHMQGYAKR